MHLMKLKKQTVKLQTPFRPRWRDRIRIWSVNVDVIYGIDTGNDASNIEYWTNAYIDDLFGSTVIIGDSIQHGFFVLVCDGSNDGVYYYDDSYSLSSSDDENNVYFIANTFDEFFTLLYN